MKRNPYQDLFSAYFDEEVSSAERAEAERLLADTPAARCELEALEDLSALLKSLPRTPAPPELAPSILRRAEREMLLAAEAAASLASDPAPRLSAARRRGWAAAAAGIVVSAAALILVLVAVPSGTPEGPRGPGDLAGAASPSDAAESSSEARTADGELIASRGRHDVHDRAAPLPPGPPRARDAADALSEDDDDEPGSFRPPAAGLGGWADRGGRGGLARLQRGSVPIGDVVTYLDTRSGRVAVVEAYVVDVRQGVDRMQVLLKKHSITPLEPGEHGLGDNERHLATPPPDAFFDDQHETFAIYVESDDAQLAAVFEALENAEDDVFLAFRLQPPLSLEGLELADAGPWPAQDSASEAAPPVERSEPADARWPPPAESRARTPARRRSDDELEKRVVREELARQVRSMSATPRASVPADPAEPAPESPDAAAVRESEADAWSYQVLLSLRGEPEAKGAQAAPDETAPDGDQPAPAPVEGAEADQPALMARHRGLPASDGAAGPIRVIFLFQSRPPAAATN